MGHTRCGAITGACNNVQLGHLTTLLEKVKPAIEGETETKADRNGSNPDFVAKVTELNVHLALEKIRSESDIIREMEKNGAIKLVGGLYEVETGKVHFYS
jgi:carbonic anhydrase